MFPVALLAAALFLAASGGSTGASPWRQLEPGLEIGSFEPDTASPAGGAAITILRFDPESWDLRCVCAGAIDGAGTRTARQWAEEHDLVAATNAGMFETDYRTHVGYLRSGNHVNQRARNAYRSALAFDPLKQGIPRARIFDLDEDPMEPILADYRSVVQNLRLIKRPGENRWQRQEKRWSEAALGEDRAGRILFIFVRAPYSMHELNEILLDLPIDLVCAQHLEGGPEAQLYVRAGGEEHELVGSFETGFRPDDTNLSAWPIPNVVGIVRRPR